MDTNPAHGAAALGLAQNFAALLALVTRGYLRSVLMHVLPGYDRSALVGFSLGGNLVLKYLGEEGAAAPVAGAVDLPETDRRLRLALRAGLETGRPPRAGGGSRDLT